MSFILILNILLLALPPVLFWGYFYYVKDSKDPEPLKLLVVAFFSGILVALPLVFVALFSDFVPGTVGVLGTLLLTFVFLGFVEEFLKLGALVVLTKRKAIDVNQIIDGVIYAVAIALGFSFMENILYFVDYLKFAEKGVDLYGTYIFRGFGIVLSHTIFAGIAGYFYVKGIVEKKKLWIKGILIAGFLHASFNYFNVSEVSGFSLGYLNVLLLGGSLLWLLSLIEEKKSTRIFN